MQLVKEMYPKAHYASVYAKPHGRKIVDTFKLPYINHYLDQRKSWLLLTQLP